MNTKLHNFCERIETYDVNDECNKAVAWLEYRMMRDEFQGNEWIGFWNELKVIKNERAILVFGHDCLMHVQDGLIFEEYLHILRDTDVISWDQKYFLLWQVDGIMFGKPVTEASNIKKYSFQIYHQVSKGYMAELEGLYWIGKEERDDSLVFVLVEQFLNYTHGPTKTTVDRARVLREKLGKKVIIINTAEQFGGTPVELESALSANYDEKLLQQEVISYEGCNYPFIQFANNMPNVLNGNELIQFIHKYKPGYIVNIGGQSLLADACSQVLPVLNVNTVPSKIACSETTAQMTGRILTDEDIELLELIGKKQEDVIHGRFTSSIKRQEHQYARSELGLPEYRRILVVIGGRLTTEIDDRFVDMIELALESGAYLAIVGVMNSYELMCEKHPVFADNSVNLGMQEDVLAILDFCDLYVNPDRTGGGTSVIEAMYKGCPVVSLNHGDVALGAGEEFCVETYEQMTQKIIHYMNDPMYYQEMAEKAKKRALYMLDSDQAFTEIINTFEEQFCNR